MFGLLKKAKYSEKDAMALYRAVVQQSRLPEFYEDLAVPDTFDGRYDVWALNASLIVNVLYINKTEHNEALAQSLFDIMFENMDENIREMGIGDMSIGKHMKRMITSFYGRMKAYGDALQSGNRDDLREALTRNLYRKNDDLPEKELEKMMAYMERCYTEFQEQDLSYGQIEFPAPLK